MFCPTFKEFVFLHNWVCFKNSNFALQQCLEGTVTVLPPFHRASAMQLTTVEGPI